MCIYVYIYIDIGDPHGNLQFFGLERLEGAGQHGALLQQMRHGRWVLRQCGPELHETRGVAVGVRAVDGAPAVNPAEVVDVPGERRWADGVSLLCLDRKRHADRNGRLSVSNEEKGCSPTKRIFSSKWRTLPAVVWFRVKLQLKQGNFRTTWNYLETHSQPYRMIYSGNRTMKQPYFSINVVAGWVILRIIYIYIVQLNVMDIGGDIASGNGNVP